MQNYIHQILTPNRDFEIVLTVFIDPGESVGTPHYHDYIEIVYLLNGYLKFEIEGETYFLKKNEIILPSLIQRTGIIKKCAFAV